MSHNSLRNVLKRKVHKERSQPAARKKLGLLEKKGDYQLRARDYHRKTDAITGLKKKASNKNPDEYYFKMNSSQTKNGVHMLTRDNSKDFKTKKAFKKQDISYLAMKSQQEAKKIERLQATVQGASGVRDSERPNKRVIFADNGADLKQKAAALYADEEDSEEEEEGTEEERRFRRRIASKLAKANNKTVAELEVRKERKAQLDKVLKKLQTEKNLMGKGAKIKKTVTDKFGDEDKSKTTYKWKLERKK